MGWLLRADLTMPDGKKESVFTTGPLDAGAFEVYSFNSSRIMVNHVEWFSMHHLYLMLMITCLQLLDLEIMWKPCLRKAVVSSM